MTREFNAIAFDGYTDKSLSDVIAIGNSAGNANITNLLDPTEDQHAATKAYVDNVGKNGFNLTCSVYEEALDAIPTSWTTSQSQFSMVQTNSCQINTGSEAFVLWGNGTITTANYDVSTGCEQIKISFDIKRRRLFL